MIRCRSHSVSETQQIASTVSSLVRPGDVIVLAGEMGAGKTAFVAGFAHALGVTEQDAVSSPTFTLAHSYTSGKLPIVHADLYRLSTIGEVVDLGLREQADLGAVVLVEWGDVAADVLGDALCIRLEHDIDDDNARLVDVTVNGHGWDVRWERLRQVLQKWTTA